MSARIQPLGFSPPVLIQVPFNAANFTATGGGSWTVIEADIETFEYTQSGQFIHLDLSLTAGTIAGNPPELQVTLPVALTPPETSGSFMVIDPEGNPSGGFAIINDGTNVLRLRPLTGNWTNGITPLTLEISFSL